MKGYLLASAMAYFAIAGCQVKGNNNDKPKENPAIPVTRLIPRDTVLEKTYVTDIHAGRNVQVRAKLTGFISEILVDEGRPVEKGQLLFTIADEEYRAGLSKASASLAQARAEARTAELELQRIRLLVDKKVIAKSEYDLGEAKLKMAEARIAEAKSAEDEARIHLSYTQVRAPFTGVIDRIPLRKGSLVDEGSLLTTISDLKFMYAYSNFSENEYLQFVRKHQHYGDVTLILADGTEYTHTGTIETMETEFDESTGSIAFRAKFPNPDQLLKHGATGKLRLKTEVRDALLVPQKAVLEIQDKNYVYVVGKDNKVSLRNFYPRARMDEFIIVQSGLKPEDLIVYEGVQQLSEGMQVNPHVVAIDSLVAMNPSVR